MSVPRTKRQFAGAASDPAQRQITSFFAPSVATPSSWISGTSDAPRIATPAEASVQANLLSVGMRVRKAVPEGYKTGSYSAFTLWDERSHAVGASTESPRSRANAFSTPRELLPFCGIHKVGGLDTQPEPDYSELFTFSDALVDDMDDLPGLTLSQESVNSNDSSASEITGAKSRKRFFAEEDDEEPQLGPVLAAWQDGDVSPRSLAPVGWSNGRVMAMPRKGRLRSKIAQPGTEMEALGQENVIVADAANDFGEAGFLDRSWEVEMGGV